jgi:ferric-dicitrate binding protein FerR (iron transport regulator)
MQESAVNRIVHLLLLQQKGEISVPEQEELDAWTNASVPNRQFIERCLDQQQVAASLEQMEKIDEEAAWQSMMARNAFEFTPVVPMRRRKTWQWIAAAVTIGILATGAYLYLNQDSKKANPEVAVVDKGENIQPGSNKAILTLGDGRTITLDEAKDGMLAKESGAAVNKTGDALVYNPDKANGTNTGSKVPVSYHTVKTPRGGSYAIILPDQSKVWLNAETSIRYPTIFTGPERRVDITGEAYFEVAKNPNQPFIVSINETEVKVLGTHFNVRAYADEAAVKTTLLEGKVEVGNTATDKKVILKPTQQAQSPISSQSNKSLEIMVQTVVDLESVIAWKNGYFDFKAAPLSEILKEIKRWYSDIDAIELKLPADEAFTAPVPRNVPLSTILKILESTDRVHFELKGKTLIVTK